MYTLSPIIFSPTVDMGSGKKKKQAVLALILGDFTTLAAVALRRPQWELDDGKIMRKW